MKLKTLLKKLELMPQDAEVEYFTALGQYGKIVGASEQKRPSGKPYIQIDVVEDQKSFDTNYV